MQKELKWIDVAPTQPEMCIGCIWGRWEATKQFCSMPRCLKEDQTFLQCEGELKGLGGCEADGEKGQ